MSRDEGGGGGGATGCVIVVLASLLLLICGGGAVAMIGLLFFARVSQDVQEVRPAPVETTQPGTIVIQADGSLLWNDAPIDRANLEARLDELKNQPGPRQTIVVRLAPGAPETASREISDLLLERKLRFLLEGPQ